MRHHVSLAATRVLVLFTSLCRAVAARVLPLDGKCIFMGISHFQLCSAHYKVQRFAKTIKFSSVRPFNKNQKNTSARDSLLYSLDDSCEKSSKGCGCATTTNHKYQTIAAKNRHKKVPTKKKSHCYPRIRKSLYKGGDVSQAKLGSTWIAKGISGLRRQSVKPCVASGLQSTICMVTVDVVGGELD